MEEAIDFLLNNNKLSSGHVIHPSEKIFLQAVGLQARLRKLFLAKNKDAIHGLMPKISSLMEKAVTLYGKESSDVWLKYVSIAMELGNIADASRIHWRALKILKPSKQSDYLLVYNKQFKQTSET